MQLLSSILYSLLLLPLLRLKGETELSFRLTPSLTRSHTKPRTKQLRDEVILVQKDISLKDNSFSNCILDSQVSLSLDKYLSRIHYSYQSNHSNLFHFYLTISNNTAISTNFNPLKMEANRPTGHRVNFNPLKMETKRHTGHRINFNPLKMESNRPTGHYTRPSSCSFPQQTTAILETACPFMVGRGTVQEGRSHFTNRHVLPTRRCNISGTELMIKK